MSSYLYPGVYIEEIPSGSRPVEGVATSTTAFVGQAFRGPANHPVLIGTWDDYLAQFADYASPSGVTNTNDYMALAVRAFFQNGGKSAYVCRLTAADPVTANRNFNDDSDDLVLTVHASSEGAWANDLRVLITRTAEDFSLEVGRLDSEGAFQALPGERFEGLSLDPTDDSFAEKIVNSSSRLALVTVAEGVDDLPAETDPTGEQLGGAGGNAGAASAPADDDYQTFYSTTLRKVRDFSIMVLPGQFWPDDGSNNVAIDHTVTFCESIMRAVVIVDPPPNTEFDSANAVTDLNLPTSTYSVLYYPFATIQNPLYNADSNPKAPTTLNIAPSSIAAGMWSRIDGKRGVWKAPAGVEARVSVSGLQYNVEDFEQSYLNPLGVNCLRSRAGYGSVIWGARTLATKADPEWRYVPVRRTAIYIEQSIYNGIQWAVFEPNDEPLWSSLRANVGSFMNGLFRAGAFQGGTANDAYFVRCGLGDTMTQGDIDRGQLILVVGFAPLKPAEFVILRIQQKVNQE
ncbi:MAG: phage tail sheath subtilisin-like domain-containing protein [Saccharospirillum sp.]|nr:phage tail sheath subtilisin-like domain-containing protein [Saccharospirillum sp.]